MNIKYVDLTRTQKIMYTITYIIMIGLFSVFCITMLILCELYIRNLCSYPVYQRILRFSMFLLVALAGLIALSFIYFIIRAVYKILANRIVYKVTTNEEGVSKSELIDMDDLDILTVTGIKAKRIIRKRFK